MNYPIDKHGRQIMPGDLIKMFHFIGPRRKRYYMYRWVIGHDPSNENLLRVSYLSRKESHFYLLCDGRRFNDYEIVQSDHDDFEERPKRK